MDSFDLNTEEQIQKYKFQSIDKLNKVQKNLDYRPILEKTYLVP